MIELAVVDYLSDAFPNYYLIQVKSDVENYQLFKTALSLLMGSHNLIPCKEM